uniref:Uncharacterized protein n=1 Tax=viral metagenome TaxID=1070528 RepID=A0A6M3Y617_9ZZZZ
MEYTKGDWKVTDTNKQGFSGVFIASNKDNILATISGTPYCSQEEHANAHRIVTAVNAFDDMYEALKEIKQICAGGAYEENIERQIIAGKCFIALAKAEGKS